MKRIVFLMGFLSFLVISQVWADGSQETSSNRIHPGAQMMMEAHGYRFDSNGNLNRFRDYRIRSFPNENDTNTNPYAYEENIIYITTFDTNQWIDRSALATTGSAAFRHQMRSMPGDFGTILRMGGAGQNGTRIFIRNIPDEYLRRMSGNVNNALLIYVGVETFRMSDGSSQVFPVFDLLGLYNDIISQSISLFNDLFEEGIFREENGYQYSVIDDRVFSRDMSTRRELNEWNGEQWIRIMGN